MDELEDALVNTILQETNTTKKKIEPSKLTPDSIMEECSNLKLGMNNDSNDNKDLKEEDGVPSQAKAENSALSKEPKDAIIDLHSVNAILSELKTSKTHKESKDNKLPAAFDISSVNALLSELKDPKPRDRKESLDNLIKPFESSNDPQMESTENLLKSLNLIQSDNPPSSSSSTIKEEVKANKEVAVSKKIEKPKPKQKAIVFSNQLHFVNYVELDHAKHIQTSQHTFTLKESQNYNQKCNVIQFTRMLELSSIIFSKEGVLHALGSKGDLLITGNNVGRIILYSISNNKELCTLFDKNMKASRVNCFDISDDFEVLIVGYTSGAIAIWDLKTFKCLKTIEKIHDCSCLGIQLFNKEVKSFDFVSSDINGNVYKSSFKDILITFTVQSSLIFKSQNSPVMILSLIKFTEKDAKTYPDLCNFPLTLVIGNFISICMYYISDKSQEIFKMNKPPEIASDVIPDAGYGIGKLPVSPLDKVENNKSELFLTMSWGKVIYVHLISPQQGRLASFSQVGYYINSSSVLRTGFIAPSIMYFFDTQKFIRIINTRDIIKGDKLESFEAVKSEFEEGKLVDPEVKSQSLFEKTPKNKGAFYRNFIIETSNTVFLIGQSTAYSIKLLDWEKCLNNLQESNDWLTLLAVGLKIYKGKISTLAGIPQDEMTRKMVLSKTLRDIINQYVAYSLGSGSDSFEKEKQINSCAEMVIEFCFEIDSISYLLDNIQNIFEVKNASSAFLQKLEPFIFCDKFSSITLPERTVEGIFDIYKQKNSLEVLEQLLLHLNINSIDTERIKEKCLQFGFVNPLIYMSMNGKNKDYFGSVTKIFEIYKKIPPQAKTEPLDYNDLLDDAKLEKFKQTKQYAGYKLLWYIDWCFKGIKFPDAMPMEEVSYRSFVLNTTYWMLDPKVFNELISCDAPIFFLILRKIFTNRKTFGFLVDGLEDKDLKISKMAKLHTESMSVYDLEPNTLISLIVIHTKKTKDSATLQLLYEFVIKSAVTITLDKELIIEAISFLLSTDEGKKMKQHELNEISSNIIKILENTPDLGESDFSELLSQSGNCLYDLVIIFLYQKERNWKKCFEIYLKEGSQIAERKKKLFEWISTQLKYYSVEDPKEVVLFKEEVMNNLNEIGLISDEKMIEVIEKWLKKECQAVIAKLVKEPGLQLKYVELVILQYKGQDIDQLDSKEKEDYFRLLLLHIELLCKLDKISQILPALQSNNHYPAQECLQYSLSYNVDDATIYLYQQTGAPKSAISLCLVRLETVFKQIIDNIERNNLNESNYNILFEKMRTILKDAKEVCKKSVVSNDELWFTLLNKMYELSHKTEPLNSKISNEKKGKRFLITLRANLSEDIRELLWVMCNFVSILMIIENVTNNSTAEFKEMKNSLMQIINDYTKQLNILDSARNLISDSVFKKESELIELNSKGNKYQFSICDYCKGSFEKDNENDVIAFGCGHKVHKSCSHEEGGLFVCYICRQTDIESGNLALEPVKYDLLICS